MKKAIIILLFVAVIFYDAFTNKPVWALEYKGDISAEFNYFPRLPLFDKQEDNNASISMETELFHQINNGISLTITPFFRYDTADTRRTHGDIRKFYMQWVHEKFELGLGLYKVFWGVTEAIHMVDIINQTDAIEALDGEEKLGQPMINLSIPGNWGVFDFFLLPYFRERTIPGKFSRLRFQIPIDDDNPVYESSAEKKHVDWAARYSHSIGNWEIGLSFFQGTSREPWFLLSYSANERYLLPYYSQINQAGLELQYIYNNWLWKLEAINRTGQPNLINDIESYYAATGGFEYTFYSVKGSKIDIGAIAECVYDSRDNLAIQPYENDLIFGLRIAFNDMRSTELIALIIQDLESDARSFSMEFNLRLGESIKLAIEAISFARQPTESIFISQDNDSILSDLRFDDYIKIELAYNY